MIAGSSSIMSRLSKNTKMFKTSTILQTCRTLTMSNVCNSTAKDVALIGAPFSGGQPKRGVERGPQALRDAGIVQRIRNLGRNVTDYGDINVDGDYDELVMHDGYPLRAPTWCGRVSEELSKKVEHAVNDNNIAVTLGGDHSIATGSIFGHQKARGNITVLWIDAHNDVNTYKTTGTGNLHGMCLSFLLKGLIKSNNIPGYEWTHQCLNPFDIAYIGLRDTDPGEHQITHDLGIMTFSMHEVDRYGISTVVERAIESINPKLDRPIHVSYDIDSLDPTSAPSTGTAVYGGLSLREGLYIGEYVNKLGLLSALDIVEVNPRLARSPRDLEVTLDTALRVTEACLGKHRSGYTTLRSFPFAEDDGK